jgi:hypothetical protein
MERYYTNQKVEITQPNGISGAIRADVHTASVNHRGVEQGVAVDRFDNKYLVERTPGGGVWGATYPV